MSYEWRDAHYFKRLGIDVRPRLPDRPAPFAADHEKRPWARCKEGLATLAILLFLAGFYAFAIWAGTRHWPH